MDKPILIRRSYYFRNLIFSKTKFLFSVYILQFITGSSCLEESLNETKEGRHLKKM